MDKEQKQILIDAYSEYELNLLLDEADKDKMLEFFLTCKAFSEQGFNLPVHWQSILSTLLINASNARINNSKNPLADALHITNVTKLQRNKVNMSVLGYYYAKAEAEGKSKVFAEEATQKLIVKHTGIRKGISPSNLKERWEDDSNSLQRMFYKLRYNTLPEGFKPSSFFE